MVKVIYAKASADPAIKVLRSIAANKASFRSAQFCWVLGFKFAVAIPISQRAS